MTEEKKNDLMVLQMRRSLDPKRFYKAPDIRALPKYFEVIHEIVKYIRYQGNDFNISQKNT